MKSYWILFLSLSCLSAIGCSGVRQQQVAALERENSQLNGLLWEMEFQIESLEAENNRLKDQPTTAEDGENSKQSRPKATTRSPRSEPSEPEPFRPPVIEFPSEPTPDGAIPNLFRPGGSEDGMLPSPDDSSARRRAAAPVSVTSHEEPALPEPKIEIVPVEEVSLESNQIERIELAPMIGTLHLDDKPGDDGLVIVVEPWDGSERMLADAAEITVVLIDPAEPKETARYAQWQFGAEEAAKLFRGGDLPGLHLELPWPGDPPRHDRLNLFVRYTTSDGRKLETESLVEVELGGQGRWVATDTPRVRPYEQAIATSEASPVVPQLLAADSDTMASEPAAVQARTPVHMVSTPRVKTYKSEQETNRPDSERNPRSSPVARAEKTLPASESAAEPEPPTRRRPTWSPDRPW